MSAVKPATTVMVMRQGTEGPELSAEALSQGRVLSPAWVFPAGAWLRWTRVPRSAPMGLVRSLPLRPFESALRRRILAGQGRPDAALRGVLNRREGYLPLDGSLVADLNQLRQWSWWITPDTRQTL